MSNPEADRNPDLITGFIIGSNPYSLLLREPPLKGRLCPDPTVRVVHTGGIPKLEIPRIVMPLNGSNAHHSAPIHL